MDITAALMAVALPRETNPLSLPRWIVGADAASTVWEGLHRIILDDDTNTSDSRHVTHRAVQEMVADGASMSAEVLRVAAELAARVRELDRFARSVGHLSSDGSLVQGLEPRAASVLDAMRSAVVGADLAVAPQKRGRRADCWQHDGDVLLAFLHGHGMSPKELALLLQSAPEDWILPPFTADDLSDYADDSDRDDGIDPVEALAKVIGQRISRVRRAAT